MSPLKRVGLAVDAAHVFGFSLGSAVARALAYRGDPASVNRRALFVPNSQ